MSHKRKPSFDVAAFENREGVLSVRVVINGKTLGPRPLNDDERDMLLWVLFGDRDFMTEYHGQ